MSQAQSNKINNSNVGSFILSNYSAMLTISHCEREREKERERGMEKGDGERD